jgi:hypothetical protein
MLAQTDAVQPEESQRAARLIDALRDFATRVQTACRIEITNMRKYRDDADYREPFDRAARLLTDESKRGWGADLWPTDIETRPSRERSLIDKLAVLMSELDLPVPQSPWSKVHSIAAAGLLRTIGDAHLEKFRDINRLRIVLYRGDETVVATDMRIPHPLYQVGWTRWGRLVWPDGYLDDIRAEVDRTVDHLRFVCDEVDRLARLQEIVVADSTTFTVHYRGRECALGPGRGFQFLKRLADSPNQWVPNAELSEASGGDDVNDILAPVKSRLCNRLNEAGMGDLANCILSERGHYGLFLDGQTRISPRAIEK